MGFLKPIKTILRKWFRPSLSDCWKQYEDYVRIHPSVILAPSALLKINSLPVPPRIVLEIGEGSHIFSQFYIERPHAKITVGKNSQLGNSSFICAEAIEVGDDVLMAWGISIIDSNTHSLRWSERQHDVERCRQDYMESKGQSISRLHDWSKVKCEKITIGNKCWIGLNAIILKGVNLGEGVVIGAGSVVSKSIPPWKIAAGNPCREISEVPR